MSMNSLTHKRTHSHSPIKLVVFMLYSITCIRFLNILEFSSYTEAISQFFQMYITNFSETRHNNEEKPCPTCSIDIQYRKVTHSIHLIIDPDSARRNFV